MNNFMLRVYCAILTWMTKEEGQNAVEYALIVALMTLGGVASMRSLASGIELAFNGVSNSLASSL
jgi:Flp pilus assembly pilin Flp